MEENGSISSMQAFAELGVTRLADVVFRLKKDGHNIVGETTYSKNRYGYTVGFSKYHIVKSK